MNTEQGNKWVLTSVVKHRIGLVRNVKGNLR